MDDIGIFALLCLVDLDLIDGTKLCDGLGSLFRTLLAAFLLYCLI